MVDTFPSIDRPRRVFGEAGFGFEPLESVPQVTAPSLGDLAAHLQRAAHTMLVLISDDAYQRGVEGLQEAAQSGTPSPVVDCSTCWPFANADFRTAGSPQAC